MDAPALGAVVWKVCVPAVGAVVWCEVVPVDGAYAKEVD